MNVQKYGPWAVIAGGSEGIGASVANRLAEAGINCVLIARNPEPLEETAQDLRARHGVDVRTLALDLTGEGLLDRVRAVTDDLDVGLLVYNAGASHKTGFFVHWEAEDLLKVIKLNVVGQTILSHHFGRKMAVRGRGGIILMGSLAGVAGSPTVIAYSGAKAYSQIFSEGLWWELNWRGVDVLHVVVGSTATPAMARLGIAHEEGEQVPPDWVAELSLANIDKGPVFVMPEMQEAFVLLNSADRRAATEGNAGFIMRNTEGTWIDG